MPEDELKEWTELSGSITEEDRVRHIPPVDLRARILDSAKLVDIEPGDTDIENATVLPSPPAVVDLERKRSARAPSAQRRHRRRLALGAIAAAGALIVGLALFSGDDTTATFVAEATNNDLPEDFAGVATATLIVDDSPTLTLDFSGSLPSSEPVELWLIKPDLSDMVSLGLIDPGDTQWEWPAGYAPTEYTLVDLSIEPDDGDPTHSGRSILRGELRAI